MTCRVLFTLLAILLFGAQMARAQQSAQCVLLSDMRAIDRTVNGFVTYGGSGGIRVAVSEALGSVRARAGVASQSGVTGFDTRFLGDFASSREQALALAARGAEPRAVLAEATLRSTASRLSSLWVALDCSSEVARRASTAPRAGETGYADADGQGNEKSEDGLLGTAVRLIPGGDTRFTRLEDFGGNPWRIDGNPKIWQGIAVFLLVFSIMVVVLNWVRRVRHRRAERHPCKLDVTLFLGRCGVRAKLVDLSHIGAKVRLETPPRRDQRVTLKWRTVRVEARVIWANQYFAGLSFLHPLKDAECDVLLKAGRREKPSYVPPAAAPVAQAPSNSRVQTAT